jgi:hypothetical protein
MFSGFPGSGGCSSSVATSRCQQPVGLTLPCQECTAGGAIMRCMCCLPCKQQHRAACVAHWLCQHTNIAQTRARSWVAVGPSCQGVAAPLGSVDCCDVRQSPPHGREGIQHLINIAPQVHLHSIRSRHVTCLQSAVGLSLRCLSQPSAPRALNDMFSSWDPPEYALPLPALQTRQSTLWPPPAVAPAACCHCRHPDEHCWTSLAASRSRLLAALALVTR